MGTVDTKGLVISPGATLVRAGQGRLVHVLVTGGSVATTLDLYDNGAGVASGTRLISIVKVPIDEFGGAMGIYRRVYNGITAVLTGLGSEAAIYFD